MSAQTIRNYTDDYGELLSASGRGETGPRLYTDEDVQVLCAIAALRKSGVPPREIVERLRNEETPPVIDVTPTHPSNQPQEGSKAGQGELLAPQTAVVATFNGRFDAIERRLEAREHREYWWVLGMGIWIGVVLMAAIFFAVWLATNGARW
jgi:DNA-binding transcriptional MerR regulator